MSRSAQFLILLSVVVMSGCEKTTGKYDNLVGNYEMADLYWGGTCVDINGDGIAQNNLMAEYKNVPGWNEFNLFSKVKLSDNEEICVYFQLPYPNYVKVNERYYVKSIEWIPVAFSGNPAEYQLIEYQSIPDKTLPQVKSISMTKFADDGLINITVYCSLPSAGEEVSELSPCNMYIKYLKQ